MPDYRLIHRRALRGEKVASLTDFERGVWLAYLLISDDYGVMPFSAVELQRASWLKAKSAKAVQRAFQRVVAVGLIRTWREQEHVYCYAPDWQEWQNVRHPRATIDPCPPAVAVAGCKPETQKFFQSHPRFSAEIFPEDSGEVAETFPESSSLARAGGRETLTLVPNADSNADARTLRVQAFMDRYRELHEQYCGVAYLGNSQTDYREACTLVDAFEDGFLEKLTVYWLNDRDKFATDGTRTVAKFRSRASKYAEELKAKKLA